MIICYAFCGSFCNFERAFSELSLLVAKGHDIIPVCSYHFASTDTRFGKSEVLLSRIESLCGKTVIQTIEEAEPVGPKLHPDVMVISPCTGNTLAKLANGITDTAVCMAAKAHLRSDRPLLIALASNDAMSANLKNISTLLMRKNVYFVPMLQDDPISKPHSLVADFSLLQKAFEMSMEGKQMRKLFL